MNSIRINVLIFFLFSVNPSIAQTADWIFNPEIERPDPYNWNNQAGFVNSLTDVKNGDVYLLTNLRDTVTYEGNPHISVASSQDILLMKLNLTGKIQWTKQIGGAEDDYGSAIAFFNNELLISMYFVDSTMIGDQKFYATEGTVMLLNLSKADGSVTAVSQTKLNGRLSPGTITSLHVTPENNIYIAGRYSINSSLGEFNLPDPYIKDVWGNKRATSYIFLAKLAPDKSPIWVRHSVHRSCCVAPEFRKMKVNPISGDVILMGSAVNAVRFDPIYFSYDFNHGGFSFMISYDQNGNVKWTQRGDAIGGDAFSEVVFSDLDFDEQGNIYVVGNYDGEAQLGQFILPDEKEGGYEDGFVAKLTSSGKYLWAKSIFGGYRTFTRTIKCKGSDCYFAGGFTKYLKFDSSYIVEPGEPDTESLVAYIGKIEDGNNNLNKLLLTETSTSSNLYQLNEHLDRYLIGIGKFYNDISIGCVGKTGGLGIPFSARINLTNEISAPIISGLTEICTDQSYYLKIENHDPNHTYLVQVPDGVTVVRQNDEIIELRAGSNAAELINVSSVAVNNCNWRALSNTVSFIRKKVPQITGMINMPEVICEGEKNVLITVNPMEDVKQYHWQLPEGCTVDGRTQTITESNEIYISADKALNGEVNVYGSNACGKSDILTTEITVMSKTPPVLADHIQVPENICEKGSLIISVDPLVDVDLYYWTLPEGLTSEGRNQLITENNSISVSADKPLLGGEIEVYGSNKCRDTQVLTAEVSVISEIPAPVLAGAEFICNDQTELFTVSMQEKLVGNIKYHWQITDNLFFSHNRQSTAITTEGKVEVTAMDESGLQWIKVFAENNCFKSDTAVLVLQNSETAEAPIISVIECDKAVETNVKTNFEWYFNGQPLSEINSYIQHPDSGYYQVRSMSQCDTKWSNKVFVNPIVIENLKIPNVITPNGDNYNDFFVIDPQLTGSHIKIYNRWGSEMYESNNYVHQWSGEGLSSGVYFYTIKNKCISSYIRGNITLIH